MSNDVFLEDTQKLEECKKLKRTLEESEKLFNNMETFPFDQLQAMAKFFDFSILSSVTKQEAQRKIKEKIDSNKVAADRLASTTLERRKLLIKAAEENFQTLLELKTLNLPSLARQTIVYKQKCHLCEELITSSHSFVKFCCVEGRDSVCGNCLLRMTLEGNGRCPFCKVALRKRSEDTQIDLSA
jgi:hypothetical protein